MGKYKTGLPVHKMVPGKLSFSLMKFKYGLPAQPAVTSVDFLSKLPANVGMMGNDTVGDCFDAAMYHGDQVRTLFAGGTMITEPDAGVLRLYSDITGYVPGDDSTDQGSDPAATFAWVEKNGLPRTNHPAVTLLGTFEIDPNNEADVLEAAEACGGIMLGIVVPESLENDMDALVWDFDPNQTTPQGGHEIFMGKHTHGGNYGVISWGNPRYELTPSFWANYVNQCTACVWSDWVAATGKTPFGMTTEQIEAEMKVIASGTTF